MIPGRKLLQLKAIAQADQYNNFNPSFVEGRLQEYAELWDSIAFNGSDTVYLQPREGKMKLAKLLSETLDADEVDVYDRDKEIADFRERISTWGNNAYQNDIKALDSLEPGEVIRIWWD